MGGWAAQGKVLIRGVNVWKCQERRWKNDEAASKAELGRLGAEYISADAQSSNEKQIADIEGLIARGANALIVLAQDASAIVPAVNRATAEGIPVVGYDRLIEVPGVFYLTFDNKEVGRLQAREVLKVQPERSEEHTSELQSLMRISYAVFCLKKKKHNNKC